MASVTYTTLEEPIEGIGGRVMFGYYTVAIDDFRFLYPHSGFPNTVSEQPVDLDREPSFRGALIEEAERVRELVPRR
jgi:hypothetical protein